MAMISTIQTMHIQALSHFLNHSFNATEGGAESPPVAPGHFTWGPRPHLQPCQQFLSGRTSKTVILIPLMEISATICEEKLDKETRRQIYPLKEN